MINSKELREFYADLGYKVGYANSRTSLKYLEDQSKEMVDEVSIGEYNSKIKRMAKMKHRQLLRLTKKRAKKLQ